MQIHLTQGAYRVLERAGVNAKLNRLPFANVPDEIGTESLLLALLELLEYRAADYLRDCGIDEEQVRAVFFRKIEIPETDSPPEETDVSKLESPISAPPFPQGNYGIVYGPEPRKYSFGSIGMESSSADRDVIAPGEDEIRTGKRKQPDEKKTDRTNQEIKDEFNGSGGFRTGSSSFFHEKNAKPALPRINWFLEENPVILLSPSASLESALINAHQRLNFPGDVSSGSLVGGPNGNFVRVKPSSFSDSSFELSSEHLLLAVALDETPVGAWVREHGLDPIDLYAKIKNTNDPNDETKKNEETDPPPLKFEDEPERTDSKTYEKPFENKKNEPPENLRLYISEHGITRLLDAAANRALEAFRVIEDFSRFVLDNRYLCGTLKSLRHELVSLLSQISPEERFAARETEQDIGTEIEGEHEYERTGIEDVLNANFSRLQESLRSLEEYSKLAYSPISKGIEKLRYRSYTIQKVLHSHLFSRHRLEKAKLYVLLDARSDEKEFRELAQTLISSGVDVIQLREKKQSDKIILERAKILRELTREKSVLFIMNDRPDLAVLSKADGIHIGQNELSIKDVRSIIGPEMLIGLSTHDISQVRSAILEGANYIGLGPVFPSKTKDFENFPGLDFLKEAASEIGLPAFAIGGIDLENLPQVLASGISRVAVGSAIIDSENPGEAVKCFRSILDGVM